MNKLYILGEDHNSLKEIARINERIKAIKPDYLLHELLYTDLCLTREEIKQRLDACSEGGICDPRLNKDIYELGYAENIPLVGIDLDLSGSARMTLRKQFELREKQMVKMIEQYRTKGTVVVVVGDAHLRTQSTTELGQSSPIPRIFAATATIERSLTAKYSAEASIPSWLKW
jgi:hypothetical protein